jgi:hypothetical protein
MQHLDFDSVGPSTVFCGATAPDYDSLCKADGPPVVARHRASHEPSAAQLAAGNYRKRKVPWQGMTIAVENEAGSVRCGVDPSGQPWETRMLYPYGYLLGTLGVDGDHIDVYQGPAAGAPMVYVIHQRQAGDWLRYDEDKAMLDFACEADAVHAFLQHYNDLRFLGPVTAMPVAEFAAKARATLAAPAMVKALGGLDFGDAMLAKAEHGPIPAGAHWITVNGGGGGKGNPILVMPHSDGSMRVIGGAGGALNHLKLRSVKKDGGGVKGAIAQRQQDRQAKAKEQAAADKAAGLDGAKGAERQKLKGAMKQQRQDFVSTVAQAMGWSDHEFDEDAHAGMSDEAVSKARKAHDTDLFKRAKQTVDMNRKSLLSDHDKLAASGLGELPLQSANPDEVSVQDLDPLKGGKPGLGFVAGYAKRAEAKGLTAEGLAKEAVAVSEPKAEADPVKAAAKKAATENIEKELVAFKEANPETVKPSPKVLENAQAAAALLKAHKKLKMAEQMARHASAELATAKIVESKSYVLEASDAEVEESARKQMEQDLKTVGTVGLLSEIDKMGGEESLGGHVAAGAFNSLNAFSTAVGGEPLIDRSVVDVLGINVAAQVLARRIAGDYKEKAEFEAIRQGVEDHHVGTQDKRQTEAVQQAQALASAAADIELPLGESGFDLASAQEANHRRRDAVADAKRILGQATGELQANAALVMALRSGAKDSVEVSLGGISAQDAVTRLHALGLKPVDYKLDGVDGHMVAAITGAGMDKLAKPVDVEGLKRTKENLAIIRGDRDEEGWLPQGFANRPDLAMNVEEGVAPKLAKPFAVSGAGLEADLRSYIGGRMADGASISDVLADTQSADFFAKAGDPAAYRAALDKVAPLKGEDGKLKALDTLREPFEGMAEAFVSDQYGPGVSPLHKQGFEVDQKSVDALHRALSATPEGVAAFKSIADLTPQERTGLRKWWDANVGRADAGADELKAQLGDHAGNEPEKESTDMFGETSTNPDWHGWKAKRDELAQKVNASSLDWGKYVETMGSPAKAISATQDLVRSQVIGDFARAHNTLKPGTPLKLGKTTIQGALNHLDAVDPKAREARQEKERALIDSLRERVNGKYASGSVSDKMAAQAEAQAAFEQAQMGFFSTEELGGGGDLFGDADQPEKAELPKLGADERFSVGHAAEQKLAGMMSVVGQNFKPGKPTKLWNASMSGKYAPQQRAIKMIAASKRVALAYGAGCVRGDVVLDDAEGRGWTFAEWWLSGEQPTVWALGRAGMVAKKASAVFAKGVAHCREIGLGNGVRFTASDDHLLLTRRGWVRAADVVPGDVAVRPASSWPGYDHQPRGDAWCETLRPGKASGSQACCQPDPRLCGEPLPSPSNSGQSFSPSPAGAQGLGLCCLRQDDQVQAPKRSRLGEWIGPHSIAGDFPQRFCAGQFQKDAIVSELLLYLLQEDWLSQECFSFLRSTFAQYLMSPAQCFSEHIGSALGCSLPEPCSSELNRLKCQAPERSPLCFADVHASELQDHWLTIEGAPCEYVPVVFVGVANDYMVFDLNVPDESNYVAMGVIHHNSGKTGIALGATAHLIKTNEIKRALHLVPSIVQDQYGGEALRYLESGQFKWHCQPGASQAERIAAYKDPSNHFTVMTHESFRADMLHMGAQHAGIASAAMTEQVAAMAPEQRKAWAQGVLDKEGIEFGATFVDEAHQLLNRAGKENSARANVIDAVTDNTRFFVSMSGDPVKNDMSELHDLMSKLDRGRYGDRDAFMRMYGGDTVGAKASLKREMARYGISNTIRPDVQASYENVTVPLSDHQREAIKGLDKTVARLGAARASGKVDVEAARALSPGSFAGVPDDQHEAIAKNVADSAGIIKESAVKRMINAPEKGNAKIDKTLELAEKHKGQPGVVFAHNRAAVAQIIQALEAKGHKVTSITGSDSSEEKAKKRALFQPESGEPKADIMVCSDAGAVGQNLQRGSWLVQHDVPDTAMAHGQRAARIHRLGQKNNVSVYTLASEHKSERTALRRLQKKYALRELMLDPMDGLDDTGVAGAINQRMVASKAADGGLF